MAIQDCNHITLYGVVKTEGGHGIAEWRSIEQEAPAGVLHVYLDRAQAVTKAAELNK